MDPTTDEYPALTLQTSVPHKPYTLCNPPRRATCLAHAETLGLNAFGLTPRTVESWPIDSAVIAGRRQPKTADVWACALAQMPEEDRAILLEKMAAKFRQEVEELLPRALSYFGARPGRGKAKASLKNLVTPHEPKTRKRPAGRTKPGTRHHRQER